MSTDLENEVIDSPTSNPTAEQDQTNPLHILQQAIANMPAVDAERVQAVINKLQNGSLEILGTAEERMASAQRIAQQIMDEAQSPE